MSISKELEAKILRYHFVERWGINTIAVQMGIHHTTVDRVLCQAGLPKAERARRPSIVDPFYPMILEELAKFPSENPHPVLRIAADGTTVDQVLLTFFQNPASYTGQDLAEIACHGGILVTQKVLETVLAGNYPISRPLNLLTNGEPTGTAKDFVDFMLSEDGQQLVEKHGYLPLAQSAE